MNIPKKYLIKDPSLLVAGQKLFSTSFGNLTFVRLQKTEYPIVAINDKSEEFCFQIDGRFAQYDTLPTLFLSCPYEVNEFPKVMEVWNDGCNPLQRVVFYKNHLGYHAYSSIGKLEDATVNTYIFIWQHASDITPVMPEVDEMKECTKAIIENIEKELEKLKGNLNK